MRRGVVVAVGDDAVARGVERVRDARWGGGETPMARVQRAPARRLRAMTGTEGVKAGCGMLVCWRGCVAERSEVQKGDEVSWYC